MPDIPLLTAIFVFSVVPVASVFLLTFGLDISSYSVEPSLLLVEDPDESLSNPDTPYPFIWIRPQYATAAFKYFLINGL